MRDWAAIRTLLLSPVRFTYDLIIRFIEDDGLASAGYLAYIALMTLLPFIVFLFTLLGLVGQADYGDSLVRYMFEFMPPEVAFTLEAPVREVVGKASEGVLTVSLLVVLWISGTGIEGVRTALNRAYRTRETRSYWRLRGQSTLFVIGFSGIILVAIVCLIIGPILWHQAQAFFDIGLDLEINRFLDTIRFGVGNLSMFVFALSLFHLLPDHRPRLRDVAPGAMAVCLLVTGATSLFSFYLERFASYSAIYGSLGGVISTMIFFYILGAILILGAELNAFLMERQQRKKETPQI
ncbi:MAG: YihY/virulence factor BrkB family protein [Alphaproteobacteria bacterium]